MMSATLSNKNFSSFWQIFRFTLFKNKALVIVSSILAFLFTQGFTILKTTNSNVILYRLKIGIPMLWCICTLLVAVLIAVNLRYMHRKKSADMFFALPVTTRKLFAARFLASFIGSIIPAIIGHITIIIFAFIYCSGSVEIDFFACGILISLAAMIAAMFIFASLAAGFMMFTGHTYDAIQAFLIVSFLPFLMVILMRRDIITSLYGYNGAVSTSIFKDEFCFSISPFMSILYFAIESLNFNYDFDGFSYNNVDIIGFLIWFMVAVLVLIFSIWFAAKRKNERAGEPYVTPLLPAILQFLTAVSVGMLFALMFGDFTSLFYTVSAVMLAMLGSVIFGAIQKRGFKKLKKDILTGAASGLAIIIILAIFITGVGFENTVPAAEDVADVVVKVDLLTFESEFEKQEDIERVIALHKDIISQKPGRSYDIIKGKKISSNYGVESIQIDYTLKNGEYISRRYYCKIEDFSNYVENMLKSENSMERYRLKPSHDSITDCTLKINYSYSDSIIVPLEKIYELAQTYKNELREGNHSWGDLNSGKATTVSCYDVEFYDEKTGSFQGYLNLNIPSTCTKTLELIDECRGLGAEG